MKYGLLLEDAVRRIQERVELCRKRSAGDAADFIEELKGVRLLKGRADGLCDRDTAHWVAVLFLLHDLTGERKYRRWGRDILECMLRFGKLWKCPTVDYLWVNYYAGAIGFQVLNQARLKERVKRNTAHVIRQIRHEPARILLLKSPSIHNSMYESRVDDIATLPALWWLARVASDSFCGRVANLHCQTTRRLHVRKDYSTLQSVLLDPVSGRVTARRTVQGFSARSCWARGQAWAILGYAQAYEATRNRDYLNLALKLFDWFYAHLPGGGIPFYDFTDPEIPYVPRDTSAAVIACCGMLRMLLANEKVPREYRAKVRRLLSSTIATHLTPVAPDDHRAVGHLTEGAVGKFNEYRDKAYGQGIGKGVFRNGAGQNFSSPYNENAYSMVYLMQCLYFEIKKDSGILTLTR